MNEAEKKQAIQNCLIYYSRNEDLWIAHGLRTDQIGTGGCVLNAYVDYLLGMNDLLELNKEVGNIEIFRLAPSKISKKAQTAQLLPKELYEVAHERAYGEWPENLKVTIKPLRHHSIKVEIKSFVESC